MLCLCRNKTVITARDMYRKCSKIRKLIPYTFIGWSTMSKGGFKKWLLERINQFSRSFGRTKAATGGVLSEKAFVRNFTKLTGKHQCQSLFLNKVAGSFIKRETLAQVLSCGFCEISKNTFFTKHLCATASGRMNLEFFHPRLTS